MPLHGFDKDLNLIEGFKLVMTSEELKEHCLARAKYHRERAEKKQKDLPELKQVMESLKGHGKTLQLATSVQNFSKGGGYHLDTDEPVESLEKDIIDHNNQAVAFEWFANHLAKQDYLMDEAALRRLQILK